MKENLIKKKKKEKGSKKKKRENVNKRILNNTKIRKKIYIIRRNPTEGGRREKYRKGC